MGKNNKHFAEFLKEICKPQFYIRVLLLFILCTVHEFTKYKTARNIVDLFYWPEGFCPDMIVIISVFVLLIQIMYLYVGILIRQTKEDYSEIKKAYTELINEYNWREFFDEID